MCTYNVYTYAFLLVYIKQQQHLEVVHWKVRSGFHRIYPRIGVDELLWWLSERWRIWDNFILSPFFSWLTPTFLHLSSKFYFLSPSRKPSLIPRLYHFFYCINSFLFLHSIFRFVCICDYFVKVLFPLWEQSSVSAFFHQHIHNKHSIYGTSLPSPPSPNIMIWTFEFCSVLCKGYKIAA